MRAAGRSEPGRLPLPPPDRTRRALGRDHGRRCPGTERGRRTLPPRTHARDRGALRRPGVSVARAPAAGAPQAPSPATMRATRLFRRDAVFLCSTWVLAALSIFLHTIGSIAVAGALSPLAAAPRRRFIRVRTSEARALLRMRRCSFWRMRLRACLL